ncbi:MAG: reverse transcriptase domain-containing protein, partial [Nitrososphaeraceae archaeon]
FLNTLGYYASDLDECLYQKIIDNKRIYLTLFVDDTLAIYPKELEEVWIKDKEQIGTKYIIKDLGNCEWIFNMKLERDRKTRQLTLSQEAYLTKVLTEYGYNTNMRTVKTPFQCNDIDKVEQQQSTICYELRFYRSGLEDIIIIIVY